MFLLVKLFGGFGASLGLVLLFDLFVWIGGVIIHRYKVFHSQPQCNLSERCELMVVLGIPMLDTLEKSVVAFVFLASASQRDNRLKPHDPICIWIFFEYFAKQFFSTGSLSVTYSCTPDISPCRSDGTGRRV